MFLLLEDTDLGEVFVKTWQTKKFMFDDFSAAYIAKYKVAGFVDREAKVVLQQVAQSMRMDIADIESRHASLRRMLKFVVQHVQQGEHERPSRLIFGQTAACWRSRRDLSGGNKTEEERGIQHQKKKGCEICVGHFYQRGVCGEEG